MSEKGIFRIITVVSVLVFVLVVLLNRNVIPSPSEFPDYIYRLPALNALLNGTCFMLLIASFLAIKKRNIKLHKRLNLLTFGLSAVFIISYVVFHYFVPETKYGGTGGIRSVYFTLLISHIVLAAVVLPLVLVTFYLALTDQIDRHRMWVRFTFPIWLYVTATGVLVYLMISPYYDFPVQ